MQINYKIIEMYPEQLSIVVRYFTDILTEARLASQTDEAGNVLRGSTDFNLNFFDADIPTGAALNTFILDHAPRELLALIERVDDPAVDTSLSDITALLGQQVAEVIVVPTLQEIRETQTLTKLQAMRAMKQSGALWANFKGVLAANEDAKDEWELTTILERNHPFVLSLSPALGLSATDLDNLFTLGATL